MDDAVEKKKKEIRAAKIFTLVIMILFIIITITSLTYAFLTKGKLLSFEIFFSSSVVAIVAWLLFSNLEKLEREKKKDRS